MYELIQTGNRSFYINCPAKIGVFRIDAVACEAAAQAVGAVVHERDGAQDVAPVVARAASVHDSRDGAPSGNAHIALARRVSRSVEIVHGVLLVHCAECCIVSIGEQCFAKPTPVFRLC